MSVQELDARMGALESRMSRVEGVLEQSNERLGSIERRLDSMDQRFTWLIGIIVGTWITTILAIFFHH
jgi:hypothetical protein